MDCFGQAGPGSSAGDVVLPCWADLESRDFSAASTCITQTERRWPRPNEAQRCELLALKGCLAQATGNTDKGETLLREALPLFLRTGEPWPVGMRIYRSLGHIAYEQGDHHKALELYYSMLALVEEHSPDGTGDLGRAHYNIGNCFWGLDQRDSCKAHYAEALRYWQRGNHTGVPVIGYIHEVLGTYAWDEGDERTALEEFNLAAAQQLNNATGTDMADGIAHTAQVDASLGKQDEALRLYQQALDFRTANYGAGHPNTACMHSDIARMLATMGRDKEALAAAQRAIVLFIPGFKPADDLENPPSIDSATSHRLLLDALLMKFRVLAADGANVRAQVSANEVIDLALRTIEHLRTGAHADASKLFWTSHVRDFLEAALDHCQRHFSPSDTAAVGRVLTIMELGRNALLADAMRSLDARTTSGLPDSIASAERSLKQHVAEMRRYILLEEKKCGRMDADKVGLWKKAVAAGDADLDRLVSRMAKDFPAYHELKYAVSDIDPKAVLRRLGSERSLLCMFLGKETLYLLLIDDRGARFVKEEHITELDNAANELRGVLRDHAISLSDPQGAYATFITNASLLHEMVFGKLDPAPYQHLAIMPDGVFHYLPFDVLLVDKPTETARDYTKLHYLINDHTVHVVPVLRPWLRDAREGEGSGAPYLGVAPSYDAQEGVRLLPLRSNVGEVEAASGLLGGAMLLGDRATEAAFKLGARDATVLHLAMHTVMDEAEPLQTALAFGRRDSANDGLLNMYELFGMDLHARIALLSACNTGAGPMLQGEGIMSMARAFQYTGCPSLVMNLWACDDEASGAIIAALCERIRSGEELDDALREAKLEHLSTSDPAKAHPFYWSTLVLIGDERTIDLSRPWYRNLWVWGGAAALVALIGWAFLRKRFQ